MICNASEEEFGTIFEEEMGPLDGCELVQILFYEENATRTRTLMTMGGRSATTDDAKSAPLSAAAAIEAKPTGLMIA